MIQILALPLEELKQKQYDINDRLSIYREGEEFAHCKLRVSMNDIPNMPRV